MIVRKMQCISEMKTVGEMPLLTSIKCKFLYPDFALGRSRIVSLNQLDSGSIPSNLLMKIKNDAIFSLHATIIFAFHML